MSATDNVKILEQQITKNQITVGKIAILIADPSVELPTELMEKSVRKYVGHKAYNEFVEIYLDNPWIRVVVSDMNMLEYDTFKDQKL